MYMVQEQCVHHTTMCVCIVKLNNVCNAVTHSNLLIFKNVSAACITCTTECTVVQRGLKFKCTWSKQSVCTVTQMCVCIVKLNNLCACFYVNSVPLVLRSVIKKEIVNATSHCLILPCGDFYLYGRQVL